MDVINNLKNKKTSNFKRKGYKTFRKMSITRGSNKDFVYSKEDLERIRRSDNEYTSAFKESYKGWLDKKEESERRGKRKRLKSSLKKFLVFLFIFIIGFLIYSNWEVIGPILEKFEAESSEGLDYKVKNMGSNINSFIENNKEVDYQEPDTRKEDSSLLGTVKGKACEEIAKKLIPNHFKFEGDVLFTGIKGFEAENRWTDGIPVGLSDFIYPYYRAGSSVGENIHLLYPSQDDQAIGYDKQIRSEEGVVLGSNHFEIKPVFRQIPWHYEVDQWSGKTTIKLMVLEESEFTSCEFIEEIDLSNLDPNINSKKYVVYLESISHEEELLGTDVGEKFQLITQGMTKEEIIEKLGEPDFMEVGEGTANGEPFTFTKIVYKGNNGNELIISLDYNPKDVQSNSAFIVIDGEFRDKTF